MKKILILLFAALLAVACCSSVFAAQTSGGDEPKVTAVTVPDGDQSRATDIPMGEVLPEVSYTTIDGESFDTAKALEDKKAILINFFKVDSPFCVEEFPIFNDLAKLYGEQVAFLALDSDEQDTEDEIRDLRDEIGIAIPVARESEWLLSNMIPYEAYPCTIVLDKNGALVFYQDYAIDNADELKEMFDEILAEDYESGYELLHSYEEDFAAYIEAKEKDEGTGNGYTLVVKDQNGDPVPNVMINFCSDAQQTCRMEGTNEEGIIFFEVPQDTYHITLLAAPGGYSYDKDFEMYTEDHYSDPINITINKD